MNRSEILHKLSMFRGEMKDFSVKDLYLFGSCAREEAREQSDVDILVEFEPEAEVGLFEFARLRRRLSEILGLEVDLVTRDAIHPEMRSGILGETIHAS